MSTEQESKKGLLVILSSPSGGGKSTVLNELKKDGEIPFEYSISATTRKPRPGEQDGVHYYFLNENQFQEKIRNNEFFEWERVHDYYYGTPKAPIKNWLDQDKIVLLDIDVNGGLRIKQQVPDRSVAIFITAPNEKELIRRLKNRKTESDVEIHRRLERLPMEMEKKEMYDHVLINDDLKTCVNKIKKIIKQRI